MIEGDIMDNPSFASFLPRTRKVVIPGWGSDLSEVEASIRALFTLGLTCMLELIAKREG